MSKQWMIVVVLLSMGKTFFYLRIFDRLSPIVTMLTKVIADLKIFMLFFFIMIIKFSLILDVMGIGNINIEGPFRDKWLVAAENGEEYPGWEYSRIGVFFGSILSVFRISMGDFPIIDQTREMDDVENVIFWLVFFTILVTTNIIMLNFLIAEAEHSYNIVSEKLVQFIMKEKAAMIDEAE
jgi:hypothetical protein